MSEFKFIDGWVSGVDRLEARPRSEITGVVVHRIEVSQEDAAYGDDPLEVARFFREHPIGVGATGGKMPYPVLIEPNGAITQTLPLCRVSPHAVAFNPTTIGVALIGDFRGRAPGAAQRRAGVEVCAALLASQGLGVDALHGHDELTGASRDPDKECPGRELPMEELRADVAVLLSAPPTFDFAWE